MKKIVMVFVFVLGCSVAYGAESGSPYKSWFTVGYAYNFPGGSPYSSLGPITIGGGRTFLKYFAIELNFSYIDYSTSGRRYVIDTNEGGVSEVFDKGDVHTIVMRPYLLIRPEFQLVGTKMSLIPYIGVGAVGFMFVEPSKFKGDGSIVNFDGGAAGKVGLAFSYRKFLINVESEYLMTTKKPAFSSGFTLGANVGLRF